MTDDHHNLKKAENLCQLCSVRETFSLRIRNREGKYDTLDLNICSGYPYSALDMVSYVPGAPYLEEWFLAKTTCCSFRRKLKHVAEYDGKVYEVKFGRGSKTIVYVLTDSISSAMKIAISSVDLDHEKTLEVEVSEV